MQNAIAIEVDFMGPLQGIEGDWIPQGQVNEMSSEGGGSVTVKRCRWSRADQFGKGLVIFGEEGSLDSP